jgi:DNA-binding MarR family transcriptional regulator
MPSVATAPTALAPDDPMASIIADFRATMTELKCASSERLLRLGVSMAQLHILYTVQRNGEMTMSHLADVLNVSLSNTSGLIDRMEERGFVERTRVPEDRRVVLVHVTAAGTRMLEEVDALSDDLLRSVLGRVDASQLPGIARAVGDLREALEATTRNGPHRHPISTANPRSPSTIGGDAAPDHLRRD